MAYNIVGEIVCMLMIGGFLALMAELPDYHKTP